MIGELFEDFQLELSTALLSEVVKHLPADPTTVPIALAFGVTLSLRAILLDTHISGMKMHKIISPLFLRNTDL